VVNEHGVTYSVLGRSRWSLGWDDILAVQAYAREAGGYRVGFRIESSGRDAELNTRDDVLAKREIVETFRQVSAAALRRGIEVGDPLGWLGEEDARGPARDPKLMSAAGGGMWFGNPGPGRAFAVVAASASILVALGLVRFFPTPVPTQAMVPRLDLQLLLSGLGLAVIAHAARASAVHAVRFGRHGIGLRFGSGREIVVLWSDVEWIEVGVSGGSVFLATADGGRRKLRIGPGPAEQVASWSLANHPGVSRVVRSPWEPAARPSLSTSKDHAGIAAANSSERS
jgi:hypothetical protein